MKTVTSILLLFVFTWASHDCHMNLTWLSHDNLLHVAVTYHPRCRTHILGLISCICWEWLGEGSCFHVPSNFCHKEYYTTKLWRSLRTDIFYTHLQDALRAVQFVLRAVDNAIALSNLQGCPFSLDKDNMIRIEPFIVYTSKNAKKSKPHESYVFLHRDYVLFTQATLDEATDITTYEYTDCLQVSSIPMVW